MNRVLCCCEGKAWQRRPRPKGNPFPRFLEYNDLAGIVRFSFAVCKRGSDDWDFESGVQVHMGDFDLYLAKHFDALYPMKMNSKECKLWG